MASLRWLIRVSRHCDIPNILVSKSPAADQAPGIRSSQAICSRYDPDISLLYAGPGLLANEGRVACRAGSAVGGGQPEQAGPTGRPAPRPAEIMKAVPAARRGPGRLGGGAR